MIEQGTFALNVPQVDYLTGTTFNAQSWRAWVKKSVGYVADSPQKRMIKGYNGNQLPGLFYGQGKQQGAEHFIVTLSGAMAQNLYATIPEAWAVKRLDLQVTIDRPSWYKAGSLKTTLRKGRWKGRRPVIPSFEDGKGGVTVYIGAPSSDKRVRIYIKDMDYLRYEIQYRRAYAESAIAAIRSAGETAVGEFLGENMSKHPKHPIWLEFRRYVGVGRSPQSRVVKSSKAKRLGWLESLSGAIQRMAYDHDIGDRVVAILQDIIDNASEAKK